MMTSALNRTVVTMKRLPAHSIALLLISYALSHVHAEDEKFSDVSNKDSLRWMALPFVLFAVAMSIITTTLTYFLWAEQKLLQEFLNGTQVEAKVVDYSLLRNSRRSEYSALVEFQYEKEGYGLLFRKNIQCSESDFRVLQKPVTPEYNQIPETVSGDRDVVLITFPASIHSDSGPVGMEFEPSLEDAFPSSSVGGAILDHPPSVYIRVTYLQGHPESATGYQQVVRSTVYTPTILLIFFLILVTFSCFFLGFQVLWMNISNILVLEVSFMTTFIIITLECCLCHLLVRDAIREFVYQDTVQCNGETTDTRTEDETIYTWSSSIVSWRSLSNLSKRLSQNRLESKDSSFAI